MLGRAERRSGWSCSRRRSPASRAWPSSGIPPVTACAFECAETRGAAQVLGVQVSSLEVREPEDLEGAFEAATQEHAEGLIVLGRVHSTSHTARGSWSSQRRAGCPRCTDRSEFVDGGGLMAYGPSLRGHVPPRRLLRRPHPQRRQAGRSPRRAADDLRLRGQHEDGPGARHHLPQRDHAPGHRGRSSDGAAEPPGSSWWARARLGSGCWRGVGGCRGRRSEPPKCPESDTARLAAPLQPAYASMPSVKGCASWATSRVRISSSSTAVRGGQHEQLRDLAAELVRLPVDVIVAHEHGRRSALPSSDQHDLPSSWP